VVYEIRVMAILYPLPFLPGRGWTRERLAIRPTVKDSLCGVSALLLDTISASSSWVTALANANLWPQGVLAASRVRFSRGLFDWPTISVMSVVNPVFEEVFVCGYVITAPKERFGITPPSM
jgi:hypothetical protein